MSHIDALNAYERCSVAVPFRSLCLAARVLHYSRIEHRAEAELEAIGFAGMRLYPDAREAASEDWHMAHTERTRLIAEYVKDRGMRDGVRRAA